jgi:hypothetical protein
VKTIYNEGNVEHAGGECELRQEANALRGQMVDWVGELASVMTRLKRVRLDALDGDEDAVAESQEILNNCEAHDWDDAIWDLEQMVDALEDLVAGRTERYDRTVTNDKVDATVSEMIEADLKDGNEVTVTTPADDPRHERTGTTTLYYERFGRRATVRVVPATRYIVPPHVPSDNAEVEAAYQKMVELKGESVARQIELAVQSVENDPAKQAAMMLKAVGA